MDLTTALDDFRRDGFARLGRVISDETVAALGARLDDLMLARVVHDGMFFQRASTVHSTYRTPAASILAQTVWASLLVLSAQADALINYTGFAIWLFSGLAVAALFVLRRREPLADRPFRTWGYPIVPGLYALVALVVVVNGLVRAPGPTGAGAAIILAGIPLYLMLRRKAR